MSFLSQGNYVDLAKRYRRFAIESGQFVSLKEKMSRQPVVGQLIGTSHLRIHVQKNIREGADTYDTKNPASNYALTTFDERASQLRQLKSQGIDRLCVTLAGWSYLGYDRQHTDPFSSGSEGRRLGRAEALLRHKPRTWISRHPARPVSGLLQRRTLLGSRPSHP